MRVSAVADKRLLASTVLEEVRRLGAVIDEVLADNIIDLGERRLLRDQLDNTAYVAQHCDARTRLAEALMRGASSPRYLNELSARAGVDLPPGFDLAPDAA
jgi:hypothetical protein